MSAVTARYVRLLLTRCDRPDWRPPVLSPNARHLLEVLSSYANEGGQAFPAVDTLAERMGRGVRFVQRARAELVAAGVIALDEGGGRHHANTYRFPVMSPLGVVHNGVSPDRVSPSTGVSHQTPNGVSPDTPKSHEVPRITSTDAVPRGAPQPGFGGYASGRARRGPRGPQRRAAE